MADSDEEHWSEPDPTHIAAKETGDSGDGFAEDQIAEDEIEEDALKPQLGSAALVTLGILAGIYLLYTLGWLVAVLRNPLVLSDPFASILNQSGGVLAVAAAPLWFIVTLLLGRNAAVRVRLFWLGAGVVALAPWPFVLGV